MTSNSLSSPGNSAVDPEWSGRRILHRQTAIRQPITLKKIVNFLGAFLIYFAVYLRDSLSHFLPGPVFLAALAFGVTLLVVRPSVKISYGELMLLICFLVFLIVNSSSSSVHAGFQFSNYLIAPLIAFSLARTAPEIFFRLLVAHFLLSIVIQFYEISSGQYLFVTINKDGDMLDAEFFSGVADVFRAKGMFQGPLSAVAYYILMILLIPGLRAPALALVGSILAYGRLGIIVSSTLLANQVFASSGIIIRFLMIACLPVLIFALISFYLGGSFFLSAFDFSSSANVARLYYWSESIRVFSEYPLLRLLIGDLGYARSIDLFTESDFLRLLLDCGLVGFSLYMITLWKFFVLLYRERKFGVVVFVVMVLCMNVFPFIQSLYGTVTFWFIFWLKNRNAGSRTLNGIVHP